MSKLRNFWKICLTAIVMIGIVVGCPTPVSADQIDVLIAIDAETLVKDACGNDLSSCPNSSTFSWNATGVTTGVLDGTTLADKYIHMFAPTQYVENIQGKSGPESSQGDSNLKIQAKDNDVIRWQATAYDVNDGYDVVITSFLESKKSTAHAGTMSKPTIQVVAECVPVPHNMKIEKAPTCTSQPENPIIGKVQPYDPNGWLKQVGDVPTVYDYVLQDKVYWSAKALSPGEVVYYIAFDILGEDGTLYGKYLWEPKIEIISN